MKRGKWREKPYITYVCFHSEGGVVYIRDNRFIWHRSRDPGSKFIDRPTSTSMELIYRSPSGFMDEVNMVELPYCCDSREEYLNIAYSYCDLIQIGRAMMVRRITISVWASTLNESPSFEPTSKNYI